jgi:hypothetical protein
MDPDVPNRRAVNARLVRLEAVSQMRFLLAPIGAFAALALGLASLGLYGVRPCTL